MIWFFVSIAFSFIGLSAGSRRRVIFSVVPQRPPSTNTPARIKAAGELCRPLTRVRPLRFQPHDSHALQTLGPPEHLFAERLGLVRRFLNNQEITASRGATFSERVGML